MYRRGGAGGREGVKYAQLKYRAYFITGGCVRVRERIRIYEGEERILCSTLLARIEYNPPLLKNRLFASWLNCREFRDGGRFPRRARLFRGCGLRDFHAKCILLREGSNAIYFRINNFLRSV